MGESAVSQAINFKRLQDFQVVYQTSLNELIDLYLRNAEKKFPQLHKALSAGKMQEFISSAKELRNRSLDIGAVNFSHTCLSLEIAGQEMRLENLSLIVQMLEKQFLVIKGELLKIKKSAPPLLRA
jgi:hypothetical protein